MSYPTDSVGQFIGYLSIGVLIYLIIYLVLGGCIDTIFYIIWWVMIR